MDPLHAIIEFIAEGYTHIECFSPRCRMIRLRPMSWLPRISMGSILLNYRRGFVAPSAVVRCSQLGRGDRPICSASHKGEAHRGTYSLSPSWGLMESETYRGYQIEVQPNAHGWRAWAHPWSPELPITSQVSFHVEAEDAEEAVAKVKQKIDDLISLL